jgi:hypothetical protein
VEFYLEKAYNLNYLLLFIVVAKEPHPNNLRHFEARLGISFQATKILRASGLSELWLLSFSANNDSLNFLFVPVEMLLGIEQTGSDLDKRRKQ